MRHIKERVRARVRHPSNNNNNNNNNNLRLLLPSRVPWKRDFLPKCGFREKKTTKKKRTQAAIVGTNTKGGEKSRTTENKRGFALYDISTQKHALLFVFWGVTTTRNIIIIIIMGGGLCCGPSGDCCESTPDPPAVIHPDPTGASRFVVKKCSRLNKDYVVYSKRVNESKKWLFLNQSRTKEGEWVYELENYVREDPAFPKRGEILWRCAYDERPTFRFARVERNFGSRSHHGECQFDEEKDAEYTGPRTYYAEGELGKDYCEAHKYRMQSEAKCHSIKVDGFEYTFVCDSRGWVSKEQRYWLEEEVERDKEGNVVHRRMVENSSTSYDSRVSKISYVVYDKDKNVLDEFACTSGGDEVGGRLGQSEIHSRCFDASFEYHKFFNGWLCGFGTWTHRVHTKEGIDPGFALIFGHICCTEFGPREIKKDLNADLPF